VTHRRAERAITPSRPERCAATAAADRIARARERDEELVAVGADLVAVVLAVCGAQGALVRGEQIGVALAEAHETPRRALDVGEQETVIVPCGRSTVARPARQSVPATPRRARRAPPASVPGFVERFETLSARASMSAPPRVPSIVSDRISRSVAGT
jgi:hypothetical protein